MNTIIIRNGELIVVILAAFIALLGAAAHVTEPIERSASQLR
jgi:hypothetical protein